MFWYWLFGSIAALTVLYVLFENFREKNFLVGLGVGAFVAAFGATLTLLLGLIGDTISGAVVGSHPESRHGCELQSIAPTQRGEGSFFLGSGNYSNGPGYVYFCKDSVGYTVHTIDARKAWIIEKAGPGQQFEKPVMRYNKDVPNNRFWSTYAPKEYLTEFWVPPGSVKEGYAVN